MGRIRAGWGTNLALLLLLAVSFVTGAIAFAIGDALAWWAVLAHGSAGLGILLLAPWKSAISARGMRRARAGRWASVGLAAAVLATIASGIAHALGLWTDGLWVQVHVGGALIAVPLAIAHVAIRPVRVRQTDLSRRTVLRAGAIAAGSLAAFGSVELLARLTRPSGLERRATGSFDRGSFDPASMPVTQWLDDAPPSLDPAGWRLEVRTGAAARAWTHAELDAFDDGLRATLDCTGGWFATQDWRGVCLDRLLGEVAEERSVVVISATGYHRRFPVADAGSILIATRIGDEPLSVGHGAPARLVAPGRRGFWWVKWIERIQTSEAPWWWQSPFPLT